MRTPLPVIGALRPPYASWHDNDITPLFSAVTPRYFEIFAFAGAPNNQKSKVEFLRTANHSLPNRHYAVTKCLTRRILAHYKSVQGFLISISTLLKPRTQSEPLARWDIQTHSHDTGCEEVII